MSGGGREEIVVTVIDRTPDGSLEAADARGRRWLVPASALDSGILRARAGQQLRLALDDGSVVAARLPSPG